MKRGVLCATTAAGALLLFSAAAAQSTAGDRGVRKNPKVETIIVTGKKQALQKIPQKATFTESTIGQETILNLSPGPATTIQTLLNTQPSIYATTSGANGMETNVKFRSFSDGEFGETIGGVPLNDIFNSGVTYQADNRNNVLFIPRDIEGVQVYRGVNNPAVNTYNSLGGTINYLPRQPAEEMGGNVGVDGGSFGTLDYHASFDTGDLNGLKQRVSFEHNYSSSWLKNMPDQNDNFYYAGNYTAGDTQVFGYFVYNRNKGNAPQYMPVNLIRSQGWSYQWPLGTYRSANTDINYLGIIGFRSDIDGIAAVEDEAYGGDNDYRRTSFSNPAYSGPYYLDDQGTGYAWWTGYMGYDPTAAFGSPKAGTDYHFYGYNGAIYGDRLKVTVDLPHNKVTAGGDFNYGELHSREYWYGASDMPTTVGYNDAWDERDTRTMWSAYIQDDIHFWNDRVHVTPGVKYIAAHTKDHDATGFYYSSSGADSADENFLSPTVGASVEVVHNVTLYASYGKNVKFPDITAFYNAVDGANTAPVVVKPEYAEDYEAGIRYKLDKLFAEVNVYEENFSHIIFSSSTPTGFTQYQNGGSQRYRGVELQLTDDFGRIYVGNWKGYLNASYNEAICTTITTNDLTGGSCNPGQSLFNVPNYLVNAGLTWAWSAWHVTLQGQYVGKQQLQDYSTGLPVDPAAINPGQPTHIPDYFLVNLGVVKVVPVDFGPAHALRLAFHVDNLFNTHYYSGAQTNSNANNPIVNGNQLEDVYANTGEPRAVFGSVGIYF